MQRATRAVRGAVLGFRIARSTRARILGWFMLIVAIALGLNIFVVDKVMHARAQSMIEEELRHEITKFREYAQRSVGRKTTDQFVSADALLRAYLAEVVPESQETFFSVVEGRAARRTRGVVPARLDQESEVIARASSAMQPSIFEIETSAGVARYAVVPLDLGGESQAALVVVEFTQGALAGISQVVRITAIASTLALILAGAIAWFVAGRILAPLRHVRLTAESIGASDLTRRIEIGLDAHDDVSRLAVTFNGMLDRVEKAFGTQRAFLDDAAHELRTPLTVIRGHLELMGDDPAERAEATELLFEEIARMDRIVSDLLLLALAERPDFLSLNEVDLTDLMVGAVARASAIGPRRWSIEETAEAVVIADEQRLTQALVQLAANAVRHTQEGDRLSMSSTVCQGQVELMVRDSGPGVPDDLKDAIFDRFARADAGDAGDAGSAGLGLAIVRSIVVSHGGSVAVSDTPGGGATFILSFPARHGLVAPLWTSRDDISLTGTTDTTLGAGQDERR